MVTMHTMSVGRFTLRKSGQGQERVLVVMKKQWISALLVLLLMLLIPVTACADVIYPAPGDLVVGEEVNHLLASLDPGGTVDYDPTLLPEGLYVLSVETAAGVDVYLCGTPTAPGSYDLLFNYNGTESICSIHIVESAEPAPTPVAIRVETLPNQTEYTVGDVLQTEGLCIRVELNNGDSRLVTEGFALYPTRLEQAGTRTIEVNYEGLLCYFDVEVAPAAEIIEGIGVLTLPNKVLYDKGDTLNPAGLSIRVYTNNGTRDEDTNLVCEPMVLSEAGEQQITVYYENKSCSFTVHVLEEEAPASIAVYRLPSRLDYQVGDRLSTEGLVLVETSNRDNPSFLEEGYTCEPQFLDEAGQQEITVTVGELHCSYYVTVRVASPPVFDPALAPEEIPEKPETPSAPEIIPQKDILPDLTPEQPAQSGKLLAAVILAAALLALLILLAYLFLFNRGESKYVVESVKDLFRRRR